MCAGAKGLGPVNLIRMGIAEGKKGRILKAVRPMGDFAPRSNEHLHQWYVTVSTKLKEGPNGAYHICDAIFGVNGVTQLAEKGELQRGQRPSVRTRVDFDTLDDSEDLSGRRAKRARI